MAEIGIANLYEYNKNRVNLLPILSDFKREKAIEKIKTFMCNKNNKYYMLLCNDRKDFTVFTLLDGEDKSEKAAFEMVNECLIPRGDIKDIFTTPDNSAVEIWMSIDDDIYCYYFFPYDNAIVEV